MISREQLRFNFARAKARLEQAKKEELRWRMLMALEFTPADPKLGTNWSDDGTVKIVIKENITLDKDRDKVRAIVETAQQKHSYNLSSVFDWAWSFSAASYRTLPIDIQQDLATILTIKSGTPDVKLKDEKE